MGRDDLRIRVAEPADASALRAIYSPYVERTAITFDVEVPTVEEFACRMGAVLGRHPYLVAEREGVPVGYAYAGPFVGRAAYDWAAETSLYVGMDCRRQGVGGALHAALEGTLREQGILNMEACIAVPAEPDEYLDRNSQEFHAHMGYRLVGEFERCGCKFGRWYSMVWMEKVIGEHGPCPARPLRFDELDAAALSRCGIG